MLLDPSISAVITGGASGLGEATGRALAQHGVRVAIFDLNAERGEALAAEIGGTFCQVDVMSEDSVQAGFDRARAAHGQERILVNCAGGGDAIKTVSRDRETGEIRRYPMERFIRCVEINIIASFRCISISAAGMMTAERLPDGERGAIICTASIAAEDGQAGQAGYAAGKAGIIGMTLPIARDLSGEGIRINTILPGVFDTPPMQRAPEKMRESLAAVVPFPKRLGVPAEYADLALTMIRNSYFNGEDVRLDGALRMASR
jgi:NAD(P)-dependent dehydrogenase (short-subunit alcohol dehydrogenase family)